MREAIQRLKNFRNFLRLAFLALRTDSTTFAVVLFNTIREERDAIICMHKKNGTLIDPHGVAEYMGEKEDANV